MAVNKFFKNFMAYDKLIHIERNVMIGDMEIIIIYTGKGVSKLWEIAKEKCRHCC